MARTLADCLAELAKGGEISEQEFRKIRDEFEKRRDQHKFAMGDDAAAAKAAAELEFDLKAEAAEKRRRVALDYKTGVEITDYLQNFAQKNGRHDVNEAALRLLQRVETRTHTIEGNARALMAGFLDETRRTKLTGAQRNPVLTEKVIEAWHGDANASPQAREFANALDGAFEWLRQTENDAGGAVGRLDNYGGPHWHDPRAARAAGFDTWKKTILPRLDPEKTGMAISGRPWSAAELEAALPRMFERITTEGWNEREPLMRRAGLGSLAGGHAEPRMLHFKSGADWLAYNADFGAGSPFQAIMSAVHVRARDIAAMQILGPNADGRVEWLKQVVTQEGQLAAAGRDSLTYKAGETAIASATRTVRRIENMWSNLSGEGTVPASRGVAAFTGTFRSAYAAGVLGRAALSSLGDVGTAKFARLYNDIGGSVLLDVTRYLADYRMSRDEATRAGLLIDSSIRIFHEQARFAKGWNVRGMSDYALDRVLAVSGLTPWTEAGRHVFGFSFYGEVADHAGKSFAELPQHLRAAFERYGLDQSDWNIIRAAKIHQPDASTQAGLIRPADVIELSQGQFSKKVQNILKLTEADEAKARELTRQAVTEIGLKYADMVMAETEYAVPTGTVRARTLATGGTRPGEFSGELVRATTQFRAYPMTFSLLWGQRIADDLIRGGSWHDAMRGGTYAVGLVATLTMLGGLSTQLKEMAAGRDPMNTNPASPQGRKFWAQALATGSGLGIFSDFVFADHNRYGNSLGATMLGPLGGDVEAIGKMALGPLQAASDEKKAGNFGREMTQFVKNHVPGSNIWYLQKAADALLFDQMRRLADPKADDAFARAMKRRLSERGQQYWWAPGDTAPARAPDLRKAWQSRQ